MLIICEAVGTLVAEKVTHSHLNGISHSENTFSLTVRNDHSVTVLKLVHSPIVCWTGIKSGK